MIHAQDAKLTREWTTLKSGWRFGGAGVDHALQSDTAAWKVIELPHTWNATDASDGGGDGKNVFFRGPAWYGLRFPSPEPFGGRRAFLRFGAASMVADVYLNGVHLGQHRGAFGAFCFEVTSQLKLGGTNELRVRVDNSWFPDIAPLAGDFPMFGGLYRPVQLLVTPTVCISPIDYASSGVAISQKSVTKERAQVNVTASVLRSKGSGSATIVVSVVDAAGNQVLRDTNPVAWNGDSGSGAATVALEIRRPRLWNGLKDPNRYSVETCLAIDGEVVDKVSQPLGLRFYHVDPKLGFFLNGEPYPLRGVARHQDRAGKGWAVSPADEAEDMAIIRELGANAVRLAHYPHSSSFLDLCDRNGLLVWSEIPLVNKVRNTAEFHANAGQQLVEMIRQLRNHPSIVMWGLFNELYHQGPTDPCEKLVRHLQAVAQREDPTRLTTAASNQRNRQELNGITDLIACNIYPGWYGSEPPSRMGEWLAEWLKSTGNRGLGVSEYGAGGSPNQHEEWMPRKPDPAGRWHPEEYQALCHEQHYDRIIQNQAVWGSFVWNAFDFACPDRLEGEQAGMNDKGLVSYDRRTRKDAFYFYKANWDPEPMVHLNSDNFTSRTNSITSVRAYSNCDEVELVVNGRSIGTNKPDKIKVVEWRDVRLSPGRNQIELRGRSGANQISDSCIWTVVRENIQACELNAHPRQVGSLN